MAQPLLPTAYFPPVSYFTVLNANPRVSIEFFEHFVKQSYRNRCCIYSPNGKQNLVVPIEQRSERTLVKDIKVAYTEDWARNHWRSLEAAYRRSAYFEYYEDEIAPLILGKKHTYLIDLNQEITSLLLKILKISCVLEQTPNYTKVEIGDFRDKFSPKNPPATTLPYSQVFDNKFGLIPDLSILDLLFNQGPRSIDFLG